MIKYQTHGSDPLMPACRQGQPLVVEARVQVDAEGQGGLAMVTVSLRPYHKGLTLEARQHLQAELGCDGVANAGRNRAVTAVANVDRNLLKSGDG